MINIKKSTVFTYNEQSKNVIKKTFQNSIKNKIFRNKLNRSAKPLN